MRNRGATFFALFFAVIFLVAVWTARSWYFTAKLFPLFAGIPGFLLAGVQIWRELTGWELRHKVSEVQMDEVYDDSMDAALRRRRTIRFFSWLVITAVAIWAFGLPLALSVSLALWVRLEAEQSWLMSFAFGFTTFLIVWGLFTKLFGLGWPPGEILRLLGLPHLLS
jgi:hypothetical protein